MTTRTILVGDIGGTNARFALADNSRRGFRDEKTLACADFVSAELAIRSYLRDIDAPDPATICLAAAGPVIDGAIKVTNNHWALSANDLAAQFGITSVTLLNDFEAIAHAVPRIGSADTEVIGSVAAKRLASEDFKIAIVGPGTGFGVAGLYCRDGELTPIIGEGGHAGFAPGTEQQRVVLENLLTRFESVSVERLVSGAGIENIYWALGESAEDRTNSLSAAAIFAAANEGVDHRAMEAIRLFFEILGQVAGDVALMFGAFDGVYVAGGIVKRYPVLLHNSAFREGFDNKGKHRGLMQTVPTLLITHDEPGLLGAAACALAP